jgi:hypothetical protein
MSGYNFERIDQMPLLHLPNDAKLVLQRQKSDIIGDKVQLYLATTFLSTDSKTVWNKGFSIQIQQIPQLIEMLQKMHDKFIQSEKSQSARTNTFADMAEQ